jgi:hypothetical protein
LEHIKESSIAFKIIINAMKRAHMKSRELAESVTYDKDIYKYVADKHHAEGIVIGIQRCMDDINDLEASLVEGKVHEHWFK